jgi:hypothetical protein
MKDRKRNTIRETQKDRQNKRETKINKKRDTNNSKIRKRQR